MPSFVIKRGEHSRGSGARIGLLDVVWNAHILVAAGSIRIVCACRLTTREIAEDACLLMEEAEVGSFIEVDRVGALARQRYLAIAGFTMDAMLSSRLTELLQVGAG